MAVKFDDIAHKNLERNFSRLWKFDGELLCVLIGEILRLNGRFCGNCEEI